MGSYGVERGAARQRTRARLLAKRFIDVVVSATMLFLLMPVFAVIGLLIKATSPGPVLYRWPVVGLGGRPLKAYKFRSMVRDADSVKQSLLGNNEATGPVFKMRNDPRVTPLGRWLRRYGFDELPQLWSVLKGDMSLVGPRPVLVSEWTHFSDAQRRKLSVKPGIACLWHIRGQPRDFDKWIALELEYIDNWSLWLDFKILGRTLLYAVSGRNY